VSGAVALARGLPYRPRHDTISGMPDFDVSKPSIARVYDYLLGGKDNFAADRAIADQIIEVAPSILLAGRENREALARAVRWAAGQGIGQFIDVGCGMPTSPSTHETARSVTSDTRVAYVDNDPVAVNHLMALLGKDPASAVVDADAGDPDAVLGAVKAVIDLSRPVCLVMGALLHFYDAVAARDLAARYQSALAPGSYVMLSVIAAVPSLETDQMMKIYNSGTHPAYLHPDADFASFFGDLELLPPGIADARVWRPAWEKAPAPEPRSVWINAAMARKTH
jgi:hypothetical protein